MTARYWSVDDTTGRNIINAINGEFGSIKPKVTFESVDQES